ncbi:MAG TPA: hypothetical protein VFE53_11600 [Mucilaginibacter sp.]|nr:hypothetical protein [Mucilaginibacter sp.]
MNTPIKAAKKCLQTLLLIFFMFISVKSFAQKVEDWRLEKMPPALETDYALSCLPPQLRPGATVYLLDPNKGYYVARKGTNGFVCFVTRTEWEWGEFRNDICTAIAFDAEGARTNFRPYIDAAAMRASGKYTALQIKSIITDRIKKGVYKAPGPGISYMLAPVMRTYTGSADSKEVMTMNMPHYMFYAPYLTNADIGNIPTGHADGPFVGSPGAPFLGARKDPYGYIIVLAGEKERAKIVAENKDLLKRLIAYKPYFKTTAAAMN